LSLRSCDGKATQRPNSQLSVWVIGRLRGQVAELIGQTPESVIHLILRIRYRHQAICLDPVRRLPYRPRGSKAFLITTVSNPEKLAPIQPDRLVTLFQPWPPARPATEAVSVYGMEVAVVVTRWLELADIAFAHSELAKPRHRRLRWHFRRDRVPLRRHRRSA
jgi:hypothetical protein